MLTTMYWFMSKSCFLSVVYPHCVHTHFLGWPGATSINGDGVGAWEEDTLARGMEIGTERAAAFAAVLVDFCLGL